MHLNMVWYENLLKYSQFVPESTLFAFWYILRTARGFWKYCKKGGGLLALKSHIICSSKKSCLKRKVDIVCFSLSSLFLIDPKMTTAQRKKMRTDFFFFFFFFFAIWSPIFFLLFFSFSPLSLFLSSPLYHASFAPSHLGYAHLI